MSNRRRIRHNNCLNTEKTHCRHQTARGAVALIAANPVDRRSCTTLAREALKYGASFGFIGLYITEKNYRKKGHGIQI